MTSPRGRCYRAYEAQMEDWREVPPLEQMLER
jgi:hypothetical protein